MPNNANPKPYRKYEFELFKLWRVLTFRTPGDLRRFSSKLRNDRELQWALKRIKTQTEFAKRFGIKDLGTLSDWNMRIDNPMRFENKHLYGTEVHRIRAEAARVKKPERGREKEKLKDIQRANDADGKRGFRKEPDPPPADKRPEPMQNEWATDETRRMDSCE